jgi:hypothetical protein
MEMHYYENKNKSFFEQKPALKALKPEITV